MIPADPIAAARAAFHRGDITSGELDAVYREAGRTNHIRRLLDDGAMVAHFAATFDRGQALRVLHPAPGKRYHATAVSAARLMLEDAR